MALSVCSLKAEVQHQQTDIELYMFKHRNKVLLDLLISEGCVDNLTSRVRRSVDKGQALLQVEKIVNGNLVDKLVTCRKTKSAAQNNNKQPPTTTTAPVPSECVQALNLTEAWRMDHIGSNLRPVRGQENCDPQDMEKAGRPWFRFTGAAGNRLLNHCVPAMSCGTDLSLWSNDKMPSMVGVVTQFKVFAIWEGQCKYETLKSSVLRCSDRKNDYIYRWEINSEKKHGCDYGFCGMRD